MAGEATRRIREFRCRCAGGAGEGLGAALPHCAAVCQHCHPLLAHPLTPARAPHSPARPPRPPLALPNVARRSQQNLSNLAWAYAKLAHLDEELLGAVAGALAERLLGSRGGRCRVCLLRPARAACASCTLRPASKQLRCCTARSAPRRPRRGDGAGAEPAALLQPAVGLCQHQVVHAHPHSRAAGRWGGGPSSAAAAGRWGRGRMRVPARNSLQRCSSLAGAPAPPLCPRRDQGAHDRHAVQPAAADQPALVPGHRRALRPRGVAAGGQQGLGGVMLSAVRRRHAPAVARLCKRSAHALPARRSGTRAWRSWSRRWRAATASCPPRR